MPSARGNTKEYQTELGTVCFMNCKCVGMLSGGRWDKYMDSNRRVYDPDFVCPTITTCGGGERTIKILIRQATKNEWIECQDGGVADLGFPNSTSRRGRVQSGGVFLQQ